MNRMLISLSLDESLTLSASSQMCLLPYLALFISTSYILKVNKCEPKIHYQNDVRTIIAGMVPAKKEKEDKNKEIL